MTEKYVNTPFSADEHKKLKAEAKKTKRVLGRMVQVLAMEGLEKRSGKVSAK